MALWQRSKPSDDLQRRGPRRLRIGVRLERLRIVETVRALTTELRVIPRVEEVEDFSGDFHIAAAADADAPAEFDADNVHVGRARLTLAARWIVEADARRERIRLPHTC